MKIKTNLFKKHKKIMKTKRKVILSSKSFKLKKWIVFVTKKAKY
jgi:hypothetical protein